MRDVEGAVVAGRYELREQIGAGGSGAVFRAYDRVLDRDVAVKRMRPGAEDDARDRLKVEARLSGLLAHPGIARVHDFGEDDRAGESAPFLVMEYVDGVPLRELLREHGPMEPDRAMGIVAQLADALAVAHGIGIVHRDVKPSNILLRPDGAVTLIDFGIARAHDVEPLTLTGTIVGTVDYISPEQAGGAGATPLSDLYALGLVAYECLTGVCPLRKDNQIATLMAHVTEAVPTLPRTVPGPVRDLVRALTARDPRRRPADAATVATLARAAIGSAAATAHAGRSRRRRLEAMAVVPIAAVALAAFFLIEPDGGPESKGAVEAAAATSAPITGPSGDSTPVLTADRTVASQTATPSPASAHRRVRAAAPTHAAPVHGHGPAGHAKKGPTHGKAKGHRGGHHGHH